MSWAKEGIRFTSYVKAWVYCYKIKQSTLIRGFMVSDWWLAFVVTATIKDLFSFLLKIQEGRGKWLKCLKYKAVNFIVSTSFPMFHSAMRDRKFIFVIFLMNLRVVVFCPVLGQRKNWESFLTYRSGSSF